jgi:DNA-binding MarR family transcriptional regulator
LSQLSTVEELLELLRETSGQSVVLSDAIARHVGLSPADLEVLGVVEQHGPLTAGRLGEFTGLSPAAVTGLIDRLERAGVAERRPDPTDRRRVLVAFAAGGAAIPALYEELARDMRAVAERYSDEELAVVSRFLRDAYAVSVDHVARLQRQ